jgi:hypothetical protein
MAKNRTTEWVSFYANYKQGIPNVENPIGGIHLIYPSVLDATN